MGARHMSSIPATMKAAVIRETGPADVMKVETDYPVPQIVDGQVCCCVCCCAMVACFTLSPQPAHSRAVPFPHAHVLCIHSTHAMLTRASASFANDGGWRRFSRPRLQVLVKNEFAGINFIDTYHRSGLYARDLPFVGGQEGGGVIAATTPKAEAMGMQVGDRVAYSILQSYSEYSAVPAAKILPVPDGVPLDVATAAVVQGLTAHYLVTSAHAGLIQPGEWMLIHGAGGGTCQWACYMAKEMGYKVIATVAKGKADIARATGADEVIVLDETPGTEYEDYESVDVTARVMEITGGAGAKCVIDGIGLATTDISIDSLAQRGIFVSFGNASGAVPPVAPLRFIGKSAFLTRPV